MKKISTNKWSKLLDKSTSFLTEVRTVTSKHQDQTIDVEIKTSISMEDRMSFAKDVCEACFDEKDNTYVPYAKEVSFKVSLLQYFTNVDPGKSVEKLLRFVDGTDIISVIKEVIGDSLYFALRDEAKELIETEQVRRAKRTKSDDLFDALTNLAQKISSIADDAKTSLEAGDMPDVAKILETYNANPEGMVKAILAATKTK